MVTHKDVNVLRVLSLRMNVVANPAHRLCLVGGQERALQLEHLSNQLQSVDAPSHSNSILRCPCALCILIIIETFLPATTTTSHDRP